MPISKKTKLTAAFALTLLMISAFALMIVPIGAQDEIPHPGELGAQEGGGSPLEPGVTPDITYGTITYLSFRPDPVGKGQPLLVNMWCQPPIHVARYFKDAYLVTFTSPSGNEIEVGPLSSYYGDSTAWFEYVFDEVGTWQIKLDFLGAYFPPGIYTSEAAFTLGQELTAPDGVYYSPSSDGPYDFVVQEDLVASWPARDLPTDYWTRPVQPENREWWSILGGYPADGVVGVPGVGGWPEDSNSHNQNYYHFVPYTQAPMSAHIVWKEQYQLGGMFGGTLDSISYSGRVNSQTCLIYQGRLYKDINTVIDGEPTTAWRCSDLRTGETIWERTGVSRPDYISWVERTVSAVPGEEARKLGLKVEFIDISGSTYTAYDPWDGDINYQVDISPVGSPEVFVAQPNIFLDIQNLGGGQYRLINWTIGGDVTYPDLRNRRLTVLSNISIPVSDLNVYDLDAGIGIETQSINPPSTGVTMAQRILAVDLYTGQLLWNKTTSIPHGDDFSGSTQIADHGKFAVLLQDGHFHCWDLRTGNEEWVSPTTSWPWGIWGQYDIGSAYGYLYYEQYDGIVARDWDTGEIAWRYKYTAPFPYETVYNDNNFPFRTDMLIAGGVIWAGNDEHSTSNPLPRGYKLHAINATTGEGIWNITGQYEPGAISDGYLLAGDRDGYLYCFGKGQSETTVTAPDVEVPLGTTVLIKGSVLDMSPAQPGTPCVDANSMGVWMDYLQKQEPIGGYWGNQTITGVPVILSGIDENGNHVDIGQTVTNGYFGTFNFPWTPDNEGTYQIIASFAGDESYGSSNGATGVTVGPAPAAEVTPEPTPEPATPQPIIGTEAAIIIGVVLIALVALIAYVVMRRPRK